MSFLDAQQARRRDAELFDRLDRDQPDLGSESGGSITVQVTGPSGAGPRVYNARKTTVDAGDTAGSTVAVSIDVAEDDPSVAAQPEFLVVNLGTGDPTGKDVAADSIDGNWVIEY